MYLARKYKENRGHDYELHMLINYHQNIIIAFSFLLMVIAGCTGKAEPKQEKFHRRFMCDAEIYDAGNWAFGEKNGLPVLFGNVDTRTRKQVFSGEFSVELTPALPFGMTVEIDSIKPDDYLEVTAMRKSNYQDGVLVIDGGEELYYAAKGVAETFDNGWEKIWIQFFIPPTYDKNTVKVYAWNSGTDTVYFDDLEIIHRRTKEYPDFSNVESLQLYTEEVNLNRLGGRRMEAFQTGVLVNKDEDFSPAIMFDGTNFSDVRFRLKGDLVDHLQGDKWSYRIRMREGFSWKNMFTFSVHTPEARDFLSEWVVSELFLKEGLLTTRYGFVPLSINSSSKGIYAWEEHFEKQLVESQDRREGPILKFDETYFWQRVAQTNITGRPWEIDYFGASKIEPFRTGKVINDTLAWHQFVDGQKLVEQYRSLAVPVNEIFDIDKLARYYALIDLTKAYHGFVWHNMRFYYNPIICKLEPIRFDGYVEGGAYQRIEEPVIGLLDPTQIDNMATEDRMLFQVFADSVFNARYLKYLKEYSDEQFVTQFTSQLNTKIDSLSALLRMEFPSYRYDYQFLPQNATFIRENLSEIGENIVAIGNWFKNQQPPLARVFTSDVNEALITGLVNGYYDPGSKQLEVVNYHGDAVEITGLVQGQLPVVKLSEPISVQNNHSIENSVKTTVIGQAPDSMLIEIQGKAFMLPVAKWPGPQGKTSRQLAFEKAAGTIIPYHNDSVIFDGKYQYKSDIFIPRGYKVVFTAGSELDMINSAGFYSESPVFILGTGAKPVKIFSSDRTAQAFNVFQADEKSVVHHTVFSGLAAITRGGWQTPSAITFYESDVEFINCTFASNSGCDDALNTVRSEIFVENCHFEDTFADAYDSDFCTGIVRGCTFYNIGNDAIDFSGSQVLIENCTMENIADKGISGGENSNLVVRNCTINKSVIAVASKDLSLVDIDELIINKAVYGFAAFIKKPEYGPARIVVNNLKMKNTNIYHKIESGSELVVNGRSIPGVQKDIALRLYQ